VTLGPLTIHFPDASLNTFWFMHDLCDVLGTERNADAKDKLSAALGRRRGIRLDYEADYVFAHATGVAAMVSVLKALEGLAAHGSLWTADELDAATAAMKRWKRPKPVPYRVGTVVAVPLRDMDPAGRFGAAVVAAFTADLWSPEERAGATRERGSPLVFALDLALPASDVAREVEAGAGRPLGGAIILDTEIVSGAWPVIGTIEIDEAQARAVLERERGESSSGSAIVSLVMRYAGLMAWDAGGRLWVEDKLLPGVAPPPGRRLVRELLEARLRAAFGRVPEPVAEGPGILHVHVAYPGNGRPRVIDVPKVDRLAERMKETVAGVGPVFLGCGEGFLDVIARTTDVAAGARAVEEAATELGIAKDVLVDCYPEVSLDALLLVP
jgi:hypothetical protein